MSTGPSHTIRAQIGGTRKLLKGRHKKQVGARATSIAGAAIALRPRDDGWFESSRPWRTRPARDVEVLHRGIGRTAESVVVARRASAVAMVAVGQRQSCGKQPGDEELRAGARHRWHRRREAEKRRAPRRRPCGLGDQAPDRRQRAGRSVNEDRSQSTRAQRRRRRGGGPRPLRTPWDELKRDTRANQSDSAVSRQPSADR